MNDHGPSVPLDGVTLILGPLRSGKTRLTAKAIERWVERAGADGTVILDFAPHIQTDDGAVGGRIDRIMQPPDGTWYGAIDARGPRTEGDTAGEIERLAADNADRARRLLDDAPPRPRAVFINDVTIALHHDPGMLERLIEYCDGADAVVVNAYAGGELGEDDPITQRERDALAGLRSWADRTIDLG